MAWLDGQNDSEFAISALTARELAYGVARACADKKPAVEAIATSVEAILSAYSDRILPIDEPVARRWGEMLAANKDNPTDKALVATAIVHGLTLVSLNASDVKGLGAPVLDPGRKPAKLHAP